MDGTNLNYLDNTSIYNSEHALYLHYTNPRDLGWDNQSAAQKSMEDYSWGV